MNKVVMAVAGHICVCVCVCLLYDLKGIKKISQNNAATDIPRNKPESTRSKTMAYFCFALLLCVRIVHYAYTETYTHALAPSG